MHALYENIVAFECMMRFWERQIRQGNYARFPKLQERNPTIHGKYADHISDFIENSKDRFGDGGGPLQHFPSPFEFQIESVPEDLQMELIEIQDSGELRAKFRKVGDTEDATVVDFYRRCVKAPGILTNAKNVACTFGSTYLCKSVVTNEIHKKSHEMSSF